MYLLVSQKLTVSFRSKLLLYLMPMHLPVLFWTLLRDFLRISFLALLKFIADYLVHLQWEKLGKQMK